MCVTRLSDVRRANLAAMRWTSLGRTQLSAPLLLIAVLLASCAPVGPGAPAAQPQSTGPKRLTAAILSDPKGLGLEQGGGFAGLDALRTLLHAGLASPDELNVLRPRLAEALPSLENGLWKLLPDGRMQTTWKIRATAQWHDGAAFTSDDVLFTSQVAQDPGLPAFRDAAYQLVQSVEAVDPVTVLVTWKEPYINAGQIFAFPLPRHLLEASAREDKANFTQTPYWSQEFVGTGPFKLREWVPSDHILLEANQAYALGRPRIDQIEVKLSLNPATLLTHLLAGTVELPMGYTLSLDQAVEARSQWQQGQVAIVPGCYWIVLYPQMTYTNPPIVAELRFRRALMHAIDRQQMVDTLDYGLTEVTDSILPLNHPEYTDIKARTPRYEYDPRKAGQIIEELGYVKGADGGFVDSAGRRLEVEMRSSADNDAQVKALHSVGDYWQRIGVGVQSVLVPVQQQSDREYRSTYPGFAVFRHPNDESWLVNFTSARVASKENNWTGGPFNYHNPEYDALYGRYSQTIPTKERFEALGQIVYHLADQLVAMGLYYEPIVELVGNRVTNVVVSQRYEAQYSWSAHLWDLRD